MEITRRKFFAKTGLIAGLLAVKPTKALAALEAIEKQSGAKYIKVNHWLAKHVVDLRGVPMVETAKILSEAKGVFGINEFTLQRHVAFKMIEPFEEKCLLPALTVLGNDIKHQRNRKGYRKFSKVYLMSTYDMTHMEEIGRLEYFVK